MNENDIEKAPIPVPIPVPPEPYNLIVNGSFEAGNVDFTSDYTFLPYPPPSNLSHDEYTIGFDAEEAHSSWEGSPHSGSNFLMANGALQVKNVWCQTVRLTPGAYYRFEAYGCSLFGDKPALLQLLVNGSDKAQVQLPEHTGEWLPLSYVLVPERMADGTVVELCLRSANTDAIGNDFGIDSISLISTKEIPTPT